MSDNTVDIGGAIKKAIPSLIMFAVGYIITTNLMKEYNVLWCIFFGWLFGGTIWGWFITGKWFPSRRTESNRDSDSFIATGALVIRCFVAAAVGPVVMFIEITKLIIAIVKLFIDRARAKKARELAETQKAENE